MIQLKPIHEENWVDAIRLRVAPAQQDFVAPAVGILARAYAYRACDARAVAIYHEKTMVGLLLVRDMEEEPACYELQQFMVDERYQNKGYGREALRQIIDQLRVQHQYDCIEVCVNRSDAQAIHVFQKEGFQDTKNINPDAPESQTMILNF